MIPSTTLQTISGTLRGVFIHTAAVCFVVKGDVLSHPVCASVDTRRMMGNDVSLSPRLHRAKQSLLLWLAVSLPCHQLCSGNNTNAAVTYAERCRSEKLESLCIWEEEREGGRGEGVHMIMAVSMRARQERKKRKMKSAISAVACATLHQPVTLGYCPLPWVWQTMTCLRSIAAGLSLYLIIITAQKHTLCLIDMYASTQRTQISSARLTHSNCSFISSSREDSI